MSYLLFKILFLVIGCVYCDVTEELARLSVRTYFANKVQEVIKQQNSTDNIACNDQLVQYSKALLNFEQWALQIFDASGKFPSGILDGNIDLGAYDECLDVKTLDGYPISGQYCLGNINLNNKMITGNSTSITEDLQIVKFVAANNDITKIEIQYAVCVPNLCSANYLSTIYQELGVSVKFTERYCQTKIDSPDLDFGAITSICFFTIVLFIVLASTLYESYNVFVRKEAANPLLASFSLLRNGKELFRTSSNPEVISCIHGARTLSNVWVILYHNYYLPVFYRVNHLIQLEKWLLSTASNFIFLTSLAVDTFFLMGGITATYAYLLSRRKGRKFNVLSLYLNRYIRITPTLAVMVIFNVTLIKYMGSGPLWPTTVSITTGYCEKNWWKTLFYFQNYATEEQCFPEAWYLAADFQLYLLSPIILIPLNKWPKAALFGTGILAVISMLGTFTIAWMYNITAALTATAEAIDVHNQKYYFPTHTRASVWLIGVLYGYLLFKGDEKNCRLIFRKPIVIILWIAALGVLFTCLFATHDLTTIGGTKVENAFFLMLMRPSWGVAVGWIILACFKGHGGPVNYILSFRIFEFLGKLSFTMYLVHSTILHVFYGRIRSPIVFSNFDRCYMFWGDFAFALCFSMMLCLAIESPFVCIAQHLLKERRIKKLPDISLDHVGN